MSFSIFVFSKKFKCVATNEGESAYCGCGKTITVPNVPVKFSRYKPKHSAELLWKNDKNAILVGISEPSPYCFLDFFRQRFVRIDEYQKPIKEIKPLSYFKRRGRVYDKLI